MHHEATQAIFGNTLPPVRVYGASVVPHTQFWLDLRKDERFSHVQWTARWPTLTSGGFADSPANARLFWTYDWDDISRSDIVMVFARPADPLRGAIFEAGLAIGQNKSVLLVGSNHGFGTWQHHVMVTKVDSLDEAAEWLRLYQHFRKHN